MRAARRGLIAAVLTGVWIVAVACSNGSSSYASLCPSTDLPACPTAPDAADCSRSNFACGLDSLPTGLSCSAPAQCSMPIFPCPDWQKYGDVQRTDGYVCSCVDGRWSCDDCWMGASLCSEAPDGALLFPPPLADDASHGVETGAGVEVGADAALEDAARTDSSASASPDGQTPVACQRLEGDAAMVSFAFTGNEAEAGPNDAIIQWFNDAGMGESCGPSSCDARCPPGHACSLAFITHALVLSGGTCL